MPAPYICLYIIHTHTHTHTHIYIYIYYMYILDDRYSYRHSTVGKEGVLIPINRNMDIEYTHMLADHATLVISLLYYLLYYYTYLLYINRKWYYFYQLRI